MLFVETAFFSDLIASQMLMRSVIAVPELVQPEYPPEGDHECPGGWWKFDDFCLLFRPDDLETWDAANEACRTADNRSN